MPPRDPSIIQLDNPLLVADLIAQLRLLGTVGLLDFSPTVLPVFIVGDRDLQVEAVDPAFLPGQITTGEANNPLVGTVIADSGQLPVGDYDVFFLVSMTVSVHLAASDSFQHRNAADAATINAWNITVTAPATEHLFMKMALTIAENERLRFITGTGITGNVSVTIGHRVRPLP